MQLMSFSATWLLNWLNRDAVVYFSFNFKYKLKGVCILHDEIQQQRSNQKQALGRVRAKKTEQTNKYTKAQRVV